jgi:tight adherence protein C
MQHITLEQARILLVVAFSLATFFAIYAMASAPSVPATRLGMRGLKRQRALRGGSGWSNLEPLVRWLGVRLSGLLPRDFRRGLDRQIALAGDYLGLLAEEYVALSLVSFVLGLGFGIVFGWVAESVTVFAILGAAFGSLVPYLQVSGEAQRRIKEVGRGLPYVIDLMALAMSAGLDFPGAVRQVVEKSSNPDDPLTEELGRLLNELSLGRTRKQALLDLMARAPAPAVTEFVTALVQAEERGNPVSEVLQIQAGVSRMRRTVAAEESAAKAGVKMVLPLFLLFGSIMLLVMGPMLLKLASQSD